MEFNTETGRYNFHTTDYVFLAKTRTEKSSEIDEQFFEMLVKEYFRPSTLNYQLYHEAAQLKYEFHKELLLGEKIIEVDTKLVNEQLYYTSILEAIWEKAYWVMNKIRINNLSFEDRDMFNDYIRTVFTPEALVANTLPQDLFVDATKMFRDDQENHTKKYVKGMKMTRFFISFFELIDKKDKEVEKLIGKFRIDPNDKTKIFISSYLPSFIKSGLISDSCLSPEGSNEHSVFMTLGYRNLLVVHTEDFSARAWLAVDYKNKFFTLAHTYPHENFLLQITVLDFFKKLGFQAVKDYFRFPEYMDMQPANLAAKTYIDVDYNLHERNKESYYEYNKSLFTDWVDGQKITPAYHCSNCDKSSANPNFINNDSDYCDACYENDDRVECSSCGDLHDGDYTHYDEETDATYCQSCYTNLEEEREEEKRAEQEENEKNDDLNTGSSEEEDGEQDVVEGQDTLKDQHEILSDVNLELENTLIRKHDAKNYFPIIRSMRDNLTIQDKDLELLSKYSNKISNYRERLLFLTMMDRAGVKWRDGERALDFRPHRPYPYYIFVSKENFSNRYDLHFSQEPEKDKPSSEKYLRYFYLHKNRLHMARYGHLRLYSETFETITRDEHYDWRLNYGVYTYSDIAAQYDFDKNLKFVFETQRAYDMFRVLIHLAGFMGYTVNDAKNFIIHKPHNEFSKDIVLELNNKGKFQISTIGSEGASVVTEAAMLAVFNK